MRSWWTSPMPAMQTMMESSTPSSRGRFPKFRTFHFDNNICNLQSLSDRSPIFVRKFLPRSRATTKDFSFMTSQAGNPSLPVTRGILLGSTYTNVVVPPRSIQWYKLLTGYHQRGSLPMCTAHAPVAGQRVPQS
jgi:hypothetical protein